MSTSAFWSSPLKYIRWAAHERPNVFYSLLIGAMGPVTLLVVPPIRKSMGIKRTEAPPLSYPRKYVTKNHANLVPKRARETITGYED